MEEVVCHLCKERLGTSDKTSELGHWIFCFSCYKIVLQRLSELMRIILLPEKEFAEWLEEDGQ